MRINEIFYSLQGEGHFTGTAAIFVRFSGCNLRCPFCDTEHETFREMTPEEILMETKRYPARHIVLTGGEPSMQITPDLIDLLHRENYFIQVETNGTFPLPENIDWITCSPKSLPLVLDRVDELKVVYTGDSSIVEKYSSAVEVGERRLQPCDTGDAARNASLLEETIGYIKNHPRWRLSLQTHKLLRIP